MAADAAAPGDWWMGCSLSTFAFFGVGGCELSPAACQGDGPRLLRWDEDAPERKGVRDSDRGFPRGSVRKRVEVCMDTAQGASKGP